MKRYDFRVKDGIPGLYAVEDGDYHLVSDVEATMIERPDAEKARKAVEELVEAYEAYIDLLSKEINSMVGICLVHGWSSELVEKGKAARERIEKAKAALGGGE